MDVNVSRLVRRLADSAVSIAFSFLFGAVGAVTVAWETFFLGGAISLLRGCFEERSGYWMGNLRVNSKILMKVSNAVGDFRSYPCINL